MRIHFVLPPLLAAISFAAAPASGEDFGLGLTAEWIEVGLEDLPGLLREHGGDFDSSKLHASVEKMIEAGKASRQEVVYGWAREGKPRTSPEFPCFSASPGRPAIGIG
jgi:hypothetical protein